LSTDNRKADDEGDFEFIFVRSFRHWKTGQLIVAPEGKSFRLKIRRRK